uniref:efflux RND transporter periplasmic adaptor subunit n=1 Tax=Thaumasiovibrio occultus TaxID=1891184 RepID=UPI000B360B6D|nr:efflux RND transporter periplasmic adaptor subunit [Thaumasiovibrio occultus]
MKKTLLVLSLAAALGGGYWYTQQSASDTEASAPAAGRQAHKVAVTTAEVEHLSLSQSLNLVGSLAARQGVDIATEVSGKVVEVKVQPNSQVKEGDVLVQLDSVRANAALKEAMAFYNDERRKLKEYGRLVARGAVTQTEYEAQEASVDIARARLDAARKSVSDHSLKAPFSGTLGLFDMARGQLVSVNETLMTLDDLSVMQLDLAIPEVYLPQIRIGETITATSQAWGDDVFTGTIAAIDSRVQSDSLNIRVRIHFDNESQQLKPGMLMNTHVEFAPQAKPVIPVQSLEYSGTSRYVYIVDEQQVAHRTEVKLGGRVNDQVMIEEGLSGGETIVVQGLVNIRDGVNVNDVSAQVARGQ